MSSLVQNLFPKNRPQNYRLAVIGEAPGREEESVGIPFVGASGRFLKALLSRAGISSDSCFVGNVCQYRPPANEIEHFSWNGPEIQEGLVQLHSDLLEFQPHLVLLLGNLALKAALDPESVHPLYKGKYKHPINNWRGSVFLCNEVLSPILGFKCLPSYHPASVQSTYEDAPLLQFDLKRAAYESTFPAVRKIDRVLVTDTDAYSLVDILHSVQKAQRPIAIDIEGYVDAMTCISIATSPSYAFIVPFTNGIGGNFYNSEDDELAVWSALCALLEDPNVPKVLQNSLYDRFVLQYSYGICVRGVVDDTMLKHWELYCELEKSLGVQASIYTDVAYYKFERKTTSQKAHWEYCCKDSCVTHEIATKLENLLKPISLSHIHYRFNVSSLNPLLYMELRGIDHNMERAQERRAAVRKELFARQYELDSLIGYGIFNKTIAELVQRCRELMCFKHNPNQPKKAFQEIEKSTLVMCSRLDSLTPSERGELSTLLELHINIDSPKQVNTLLYDKLKLPIQTNKEGRLTSDEGALLTLRKKTSPDSLGHKVTNLAIQIRRLGTHAGMLSIHPDGDGRIRCGYNIVGTETGRLSCYKSPTGSGYNLQTIPSEDRDLFRADSGCWFFQCDLSGADGWTVAAHSATLGDPTMLLDLEAGIKPAKVLCLGLRGNIRALSPTIPRDELKDLCKTVKKEDWDYFTCKIGQHGSCYLMGKILLSRQIFEESDGKVSLSPRECEELQRLFFARYHGIKRWHETTERNLSKNQTIVAASGHRRVFFGRRNEILGKALAFEPQSNTTYATNLAVLNLWQDPENRVEQSLRIEPLHQVHDALCGQFRKEDTVWAIGKIKNYFDNALIIAGRSIKIPFEGGYGPSWGELSEGTI